MANEEINDQTAKTTLADTDEILIQETGGGNNRKATRANLLKGLTWLNLGAPEAKTIASGVITVTMAFAAVTAQTTAADDLDTISGTANGDIVIIVRSGAYDVTLKDGVDNLVLAGDFLMDTNSDTIMLINRGGTNLYELSRSNNA